MKKFKWNEKTSLVNYWDDDGTAFGKNFQATCINKELVNNPGTAKSDDVLRALCCIVSELMEIEENRNDR